tara:strand:+ start:5598 stop:6746 length:1149 start_codon:yes stop_codon:yes gene_type:complete
MKFTHLADCHLGGWKLPELDLLNFQSFKIAIEKSIKEQVDFVLIAGDLFDSAYPPIDTLKNAFREFRKLKESGIPCFIIAGSHDYSVSGKTFLDVLEKAGLCKNVTIYEQREDKIMLLPTIYKNVAIYGYPGKKSSLEVDELEHIKLQDAPGMFKILMLHTAIKDAVPNIPMKSVNQDLLPKTDYLALGHLHINYNRKNRVYSGPTFPNNLSELEELKCGSFYIYESGIPQRQEIKLKEFVVVNMKVTNTLEATEQILSQLQKENLKDKIVIVKLYGIVEQGRISDIDFQRIESYVRENQAYTFLKTTTRLHTPQQEMKMDISDSENLESQIIKKFESSHPSKFNSSISPIIKALQIEKLEDEKVMVFQDRLISESKKILEI